jgi:hypothetical protein
MLQVLDDVQNTAVATPASHVFDQHESSSRFNPWLGAISCRLGFVKRLDRTGVIK